MNESEKRKALIKTVISRDDRLDRACDDIPAAQCTALPKNAALNLVNGAAAKLAEQVSSAKLTLPWLLASIGAPALFIGLVMPLRQAGTLIPQLAIAGRLRRFAVRKWFWVGAAVVQAIMLAGIIAAAVLLPPITAGAVIIGCLLVFSMARGVGSVAFQDVTGKTIPKGRRGRLLAARSMIGGLLTIGTGIAIAAYSDMEDTLTPALLLVTLGIVLWLIAAMAFALIKESPGAVAGGRSAWQEAKAGVQLVKKQTWFARFLMVRTALLSIELSAPFYILYVKEQLPGNGPGGIGAIVLAAGVAAALSSPFWGRFADLSSRKVLMISGWLGAATGLYAIGLAWLPPAVDPTVPLAAIFVLLGITEAGVLLGRKTYLIDRVPAEARPTYVAFANSLLGGIALLFGLLGVVAQTTGTHWLIALFVALSIAGGLLSIGLPEATPKPQKQQPAGSRMPVGADPTARANTAAAS